jgi:hypothetical protein
MDIQKHWEKALKETEIIRVRVKALLNSQATRVPYILLSESSINMGDTVVRTGEVMVDKPSLVVPPNNPMFSGFELDEQGAGFKEDSLVNFLIVRGVSLPSLRYDNRTSALEVYEGRLSSAITHYRDLLQRQENTSTGLLAGPEDCWQFSLLIFICLQVVRNADQDIRKLLDDYHRRNND